MYKKLGYAGIFFIIVYYFLKNAIFKGLKRIVKEIVEFLLQEDKKDSLNEIE